MYYLYKQLNGQNKINLIFVCQTRFLSKHVPKPVLKTIYLISLCSGIKFSSVEVITTHKNILFFFVGYIMIAA